MVRKDMEQRLVIAVEKSNLQYVCVCIYSNLDWHPKTGLDIRIHVIISWLIIHP